MAQGLERIIIYCNSTPNGRQYNYRATPAPLVGPRLALALAPALLPAPGPASDARAGRAPALWPGLQFTISGLLAGRATRQPRALARPESPGAGLNLIQPGGEDGKDAPAYVAWVTRDAQGHIVGSGRTELPVTSLSTKDWDHATVNLPVNLGDVASGTGSLEVSLVNDGQAPVYFDSVTIRHPRPALVISQENHYYPFGLNMQGIAVNTLPEGPLSKAQYNGGSPLEDEVLDDAGVNSTPFRTYDPTLGRFQGVDPLADKYGDQTPYQFAGNDPVNHNDPTGAEIDDNGHISMGGRFGNSRGFDSFGFNNGGAGMGSFGGLDATSGGLGTYAAALAGANASFVQAWFKNTGLAALNKFIPGLNAQWDSQHGSFGSYTTNAVLGAATDMYTHLPEIGVRATFLEINMLDDASVNNPSFKTGLLSFAVGVADVVVGSAGLEKTLTSGQKLFGETTGYVGAGIALAYAGYEIVNHQADTHTFVNAAIAVTGIVLMGVAAATAVGPVVVGFGAVALVYGLFNTTCNLDAKIDDMSGHWGKDFIYNR